MSGGYSNLVRMAATGYKGGVGGGGGGGVDSVGTVLLQPEFILVYRRGVRLHTAFVNIPG